MAVGRFPTIEHIIYAVVVAGGLALRLADLGGQPLEPGEATLALASWHVTLGAPASLDAGPLPVFATAALFFMFGAGDAAARILPAVIGGTLPLAAPLLRPHLGRWGALGAAAALALSPTLVEASRRADAAGLALGVAALVCAALVVPLGPRRQFLGLAAGGLTACGAAGFLALTALAAVAAWPWQSPKATRRGERLLPDVRSAWREPAAIAAVTSALAATGGLANPGGWGQGVWQPFVTWLLGIGDPLPALWGYARALILLDPSAPLLIALAIAVARGRLLGGLPGRFMAGAAVLVVMGALTGVPPATVLPLAVAPAVAAAGGALAGEVAAGFAALIASDGWATVNADSAPSVAQETRVAWPLALGLGMVGAAVGLWLLALVISSATLPGGPPRVFGAPVTGYFVATLGALALAGAVGIQALGPARARQTALLTAVGASLALALHGATWGPVLAAGGVEAQAGLRSASPDLRNLVDEIERHSAIWSTPGRKDVPLALDSALEVPLAWYLRDYEGRGVRPEMARLVVQPADAPLPAGRFVQRRYRIAVSGHAPAVEDLWRWFLYRERAGPRVPVEVLLLVRVD